MTHVHFAAAVEKRLVFALDILGFQHHFLLRARQPQKRIFGIWSHALDHFFRERARSAAAGLAPFAEKVIECFLVGAEWFEAEGESVGNPGLLTRC